MKEFDVTIIGAGLAGLFLAKNLARGGVKVLLVDRKEDLSKGVHTTGIFVRKTFEDFGFPKGTLGRPISNVNLYSPSLRKLCLSSPHEEFRVGRMGLLYKTLLDDCIWSGVEFRPGTRFLGAKRCAGSTTTVSIEKRGNREDFSTRVLVGGDGAKSKVARDLGLDQNREWIVGYEEVFKVPGLNGNPVLECFLNDKLAPGYLAWISNDGEECHIGVGGYPSRFDPRAALKVFKQEIVPLIIETNGMEFIESRGGRIPVGGILRNISCRHGLLIGDAAGAVSPLTAGGLDPCLRLSRFAAGIISKRFEKNDPDLLGEYSGLMFQKKFAVRRVMRWALRAATNPLLLETGFSFLKTKPGRYFANQIFFRRASFPEPGSGAVNFPQMANRS